MKSNETEKPIEDYLVESVERLGGLCLKLCLIGLRGWPDRTLVFYRAIYFVETKRPKGGRLSAQQKFWRRVLARLGWEVETICTKKQVDEFLLRVCSGTY